MPANLINLLLTIISAVAAITSVIFAWKATTAAERSNTIALIAGLHQLYHSQATFLATQRVWALYRRHQGKDADGTPITDQQTPLPLPLLPPTRPHPPTSLHPFIRFPIR